MNQLRSGLLSGTMLAALAVGTPMPAAAQSGQEPADMILRNGKIVTVDDEFGIAEAVAIDDGRFLAVGSDDAVMAHEGPETEVVDLEGRTVIPGLIDSHLHQIGAALNAPRVSLLEARSIADVAAAIGARAEATPPGEWVMASSAWHESALEEGRLPTRADLDPVSPDNPVFIPRGGHVITVNSRALELAGVTGDTPDPEGGVIVRDEGGEPTGVLLEEATHLVEDILPPPPPPEEQAGLVKDYMRRLNAYGIVGVTEPGLSDEQIALYKRLHEQGDMTVRTYMLYRAREQEAAREAIDAHSRELCDEMLCFGGLKLPLDGGVEGARLYQPYEVVEGEQPDPDYRGVMLLPSGGVEELRELLGLAADAGWQVQAHAVGDETIDTVVDAYAAVDEATPIEDLRWAVMHIFLPTEEAMRTMAERDILATVQDHPLLLGHNQRRYWGEERAAYAIPIRALLDHGIRVGGGTDAPVLPADPFRSMWWMVTRRTLNGDTLGAEQGIPIEDALRLYTVGSAYTQFAEDERGSIEPGKLADLVVLSDDILTVPADGIKDVTALATLLGGEVVHDTGVFGGTAGADTR